MGNPENKRSPGEVQRALDTLKKSRVSLAIISIAASELIFDKDTPNTHRAFYSYIVHHIHEMNRDGVVSSEVPEIFNKPDVVKAGLARIAERAKAIVDGIVRHLPDTLSRQEDKTLLKFMLEGGNLPRKLFDIFDTAYQAYLTDNHHSIVPPGHLTTLGRLGATNPRDNEGKNERTGDGEDYYDE